LQIDININTNLINEIGEKRKSGYQ